MFFECKPFYLIVPNETVVCVKLLVMEIGVDYISVYFPEASFGFILVD